MIEIDLDTIVSILREIYEQKQAPLNKSDIDSDDRLPSYNTCMRRGLRLDKLNQELVRESYYSSPKECKCCSVTISYEKKINDFCGSSCAATFNCTGRVRLRKEEDFDLLKARKRRYKIIDTPVGEKPKIVKITNCVNCDIEIAEMVDVKRKYCSVQCQSDFKFEERFRDWFEFGKSFGNRTIRDFLSVCRGYYCEHCGISDWNGKPITLEVEHIDGNSGDSSPDNVCLLCPNCHSQTPTYKSKNIGKGRHARKLRYQEGKSY